MKPVARIQGIPRVRNSRNLNPGKDFQTGVENSTRISRMYAPVGVVGFPKSGRKTLAHRFERMEEGTFNQEVPVKNPYGTEIEGEFYPPESNRRFVLILKFYIINQESLPPRYPPLDTRNWNEFCCMIVVFDVTEIKTFHAVPMYLTRMRIHNFNIQRNFLIVGNKSDLRRAHVTRSRPEVSVQTAERMAAQFEGTYHECSAKKPENVWPLLAAIKNFGAKKRYEK
ncbi:hypothetical protein AVEN_62992-1 [Araneus ventricosus]|uniref:Uncharacterized protein n=1 Tax=Araneus ventricosus TaxID=182803 RepID=A0A4Y2CST8_ARAVE|nr:hypothetical protein AVEN_62992-1 [Araneus ventricosus]